MAEKTTYLAGIDIGSTGCKITVYDSNGHYCFRSYKDYPVQRNVCEHEIDALNILSGVKEVIKETAAKYPEIMAIGVTSFGESCVLLDEADKALWPVMLYTDPRGEKECEYLVSKLGKERIQKTSGVNPHSMYSLPKVMWLKNNYPKDFAGVKRIMLMEDYIIYSLTGNAVIDYSLATRSMAFDINNLGWSGEILNAAQIDKSLFSKAVPSGTIAGEIKSGLKVELGLKSKTIIIPVGHDQIAAAIGAGVFEKGTAVDGAGTVECVTPVFDKSADLQKLCANNYAIVPYINNTFVTYAFSYTGGALINWYIENLAKGEKLQANETGVSVYEILEKQMKNNPGGILVLPHFAGAATPYMDTGSKGAIIGLDLSHSAADIYKAMMEGVAYEMRLNIEQLKESGVNLTKLSATGGGAASEVWMQIKADVLGLPITSLDSKEAGAAGCVMTAGVASGIFEDIEQAAKTIVKSRKTYFPDKEKHKTYSQYFEKYKGLYNSVRPLV